MVTCLRLTPGAGVIIRDAGDAKWYLGVFGSAAEFVSDGESRLEFNRPVEVGSGSLQVALGFFGIAEVGVSAGVFRIEFNCPVEVGNGSVQIALGVFGVAA